MAERETARAEIAAAFPEILVTSSFRNNLELNAANADKGRALLALAQHLGIPAADTIAFGDSSNDLRMLQNLKEMEEPFEKTQIGSSAMAYKRNPMRSERICSLARYVMINELDPAMTASVQWFERTLDDSANKRVVVAESFLAVDGILQIMLNVTSGMVVYPKVIHSHVMAELPFMATEMILMENVKRGGDRQDLHERIRVHSMAAAAQVKQEGKPNDLIERILADPAFKMSREELMDALKPENFIGRAPQQVEDFLSEYIDPILNAHQEELGLTAQLSV